MNKFLGLVLCLHFLFNGVQIVNADLIEHTDIFDSNHIKINFMETVFWEFDITNDGFDPLTMDVIEASIELVLEDDEDETYPIQTEWAWLEVGETFEGFWQVDTKEYTFAVSSLMTINENGTITSSLTSVGGDFYFNSATLTAKSISTVPEPTTISLVGFSLVGILGLGLRRKMKQIF